MRLAQDGKIFAVVEGRETPTPLDMVEAVVSDWLREGASSLIVEAAPDLEAGWMVQVMDEARRGGAQNIALMMGVE